MRNRLAILAACAVAGAAAAQPAPPLIREPLGLDPAYNATVLTVDLPPNPKQPATTVGTPGHRHPGSTYAYVVAGCFGFGGRSTVSTVAL